MTKQEKLLKNKVLVLCFFFVFTFASMQNNSEISIAALEIQAQKYEDIARQIRHLITLLNGEVKEQVNPAPVNLPAQKFVRTTTRQIESWLNSAFSDGTPKRVKDLYSDFRNGGYEESDFKNFRYKLTQFVLPNSKSIRRYTVEGEKNENKFWYGISKWFDGDELQKPYLDKIQKALESAS